MTSATRPATATMRAIVQHRYGSSDVLELANVATPSPGDDEVLVRVHAAGLDKGTWHLMEGLPRLVRLGFGLRAPKRATPGLDLAGIVAGVGSNVTEFEVGAEVFGIGTGSFAEYACAPATKLAPKPAGLTFEQAAVVPVSGLTALQGLRDAGRLEAGQHVLITGASGGVGSYAVQIAKHFGAEVSGVCSGAKADFVRSLGADHVIDYATADPYDTPEPYDLIFDLVGTATLRRLRRTVTRNGTVVAAGIEHGGDWTGGTGRYLRATFWSPFVSQRLTMMLSKETAIDVKILAELIEAGAVVPALDQTFPLEHAAEAMRQMETGAIRGKVAISIAD